MGTTVVHALDGVDVDIAAGEFVSIVGASGSGKSTLMHILGLLDRPTGGLYRFGGMIMAQLTDHRLATIRNQHIGFVFQTFNLIRRTTALDNVLVPSLYSRRSPDRTRAREALERVGLKDRIKHRPSEMSGGECQRVAIARAIVNSPRLLLADEPTGNLDSRTGAAIMRIFHELSNEGMTIVLVTHELDIAVRANRMIQMRDGLIVADTVVDQRRREEILAMSDDAQRKVFQRSADEESGVTVNAPRDSIPAARPLGGRAGQRTI